MTFFPHVELALGMELTLNLAWALITIAMLCAWLHIAPPAARERRAQFVALAVVILILLPAISMTDDLMAAQNPAEIDCSVRRDHGCANANWAAPISAAMPLPIFAASALSFQEYRLVSHPLTPPVENPSLTSIENRPPPAA